ncbi:MAG: protein-L-isoaspartate(D-aspartate) O-methyltransferase [bacterium]|nr:protein-L-isoaspartate(D-aspartate) O-methyltransferase [bacterium]
MKNKTDHYQQQRQTMVERHIRGRGVKNERVLEAMMAVPREEFVSSLEKNNSYHDGPLPIGHGQTISQPFIVSYMTEILELTGNEKVLELGTGSGYQTAVLAEIVKEVYTIEVIESLGENARKRLTENLGYTNIHFKFANGRDGWEEYAPYDRIILTAAPIYFPEKLFEQLAEGAMAIAPVGDHFQQLVKYRKIQGKIKSQSLLPVAFVPFV